MSLSAYSRMENGSCNTWANKINEICKLYEIEPEELLKEEIKTTNNVQEANNCNIGCDKGIVNNNFPEGVIENMLKRIITLEQKIDKLGGSEV